MKSNPWTKWQVLFYVFAITITAYIGAFGMAFATLFLVLPPTTEIPVTLPAWAWMSGFIGLMVKFFVGGYYTHYFWVEWHRIKSKFSVEAKRKTEA